MGNNKYKQRHREMGLCSCCSEPVVPGMSYCKKHLKTHYISDRIYVDNNPEKIRIANMAKKEKARKEGRCRDCGKPLDSEIDEGKKLCLNCRIKCRRPMWARYGINRS